jgi:GMP synthase (glutamine-hydrolysing)
LDKIVILDFGSQTTQLIGRRIRELGVYAEIYPGDAPLTPAMLDGAKGIILSGSPFSVYEDGSPAPDRAVYGAGLPILGICYGLQRMTSDYAARVAPTMRGVRRGEGDPPSRPGGRVGRRRQGGRLPEGPFESASGPQPSRPG